MSSERFQIFGAVYLAMLRENQVFLLCRANTGFRDGCWCLPSGHIEKGETPEEAAIREAKEEAGVDVKARNLEFGCTLFRMGYGGRERTYADYMFVVKSWQQEPYNSEPAKASAGRWFDLDELPESIIGAQSLMLTNYSKRLYYCAISEPEF